MESTRRASPLARTRAVIAHGRPASGMSRLRLQSGKTKNLAGYFGHALYRPPERADFFRRAETLGPHDR